MLICIYTYQYHEISKLYNYKLIQSSILLFIDSIIIIYYHEYPPLTNTIIIYTPSIISLLLRLYALMYILYAVKSTCTWHNQLNDYIAANPNERVLNGFDQSSDDAATAATSSGAAALQPPPLPPRPHANKSNNNNSSENSNNNQSANKSRKRK